MSLVAGNAMLTISKYNIDKKKYSVILFQKQLLGLRAKAVCSAIQSKNTEGWGKIL